MITRNAVSPFSLGLVLSGMVLVAACNGTTILVPEEDGTDPVVYMTFAYPNADLVEIRSGDESAPPPIVLDQLSDIAFMATGEDLDGGVKEVEIELEGGFLCKSNGITYPSLGLDEQGNRVPGQPPWVRNPSNTSSGLGTEWEPGVRAPTVLRVPYNMSPQDQSEILYQWLLGPDVPNPGPTGSIPGCDPLKFIGEAQALTENVHERRAWTPVLKFIIETSSSEVAATRDT